MVDTVEAFFQERDRKQLREVWQMTGNVSYPRPSTRKHCMHFFSPFCKHFICIQNQKLARLTVRETRFVKLDDEILDAGTIMFIDDVPLLSDGCLF